MIGAWSQNGYAEFYAGGSLGSVQYDLGRVSASEASDLVMSDFGLSGTVTLTRVRDDDTDTGWKLFGGYNINENFGVEVFYADFGEITERIVAGVDATDGVDTYVGDVNLRARLEVTGFGANILGRYPIKDSMAIYAKLGIFRHSTDAKLSFAFDGTVNGTAATASESAKDDDDGTGYVFGIGGEHRFSNGLGLRVEWERYKIDTFDSDIDPDVLSGSIFYAFKK